jgi:ribosomal protein S18 acetylase RimI-like enzyme
MLTYKEVNGEEVVEFLELLREDARDYLDQTIALMGETWEHFLQIAQQVGKVYGVSLDGQTAGYYWIEERGKELHLHGILVKAAFRGQGIGTRILEKLRTDYAGKMEVIELGVHDSNIRAIALYERMGFVTVRRVEEVGFKVMQLPIKGEEERG